MPGMSACSPNKLKALVYGHDSWSSHSSNELVGSMAALTPAVRILCWPNAATILVLFYRSLHMQG